MPEFAFVHDFALTRAFIVVVLSPWRAPATGFARAIPAPPLARGLRGRRRTDAEPTRVLVVGVRRRAGRHRDATAVRDAGGAGVARRRFTTSSMRTTCAGRRE